jgi:hypothetical protein
MIATVPEQAAAFAGAATTTAVAPESAIAEETATTPRRENFFIEYSFQGMLDFPTGQFSMSRGNKPIGSQKYLAGN